MDSGQWFFLVKMSKSVRIYIDVVRFSIVFLTAFTVTLSRSNSYWIYRFDNKTFWSVVCRPLCRESCRCCGPNSGISISAVFNCRRLLFPCVPWTTCWSALEHLRPIVASINTLIGSCENMEATYCVGNDVDVCRMFDQYLYKVLC